MLPPKQSNLNDKSTQIKSTPNLCNRYQQQNFQILILQTLLGRMKNALNENHPMSEKAETVFLTNLYYFFRN